MEDKYKGLTNNLITQIDKIFDNAREGSFRTRERYRSACHSFAGFLAKEFRLQKFKNLQEKHITAYAAYMKNENRATGTIKTDLSAIRYAHDKSGSRNILPDNKSFNLEKRTYGTANKAWTVNEIKMAKDLALIQGRPQIYHAINLSSTTGARLEGVALMSVRQLEHALDYKELYLKEKGGLERYVPLTKESQLNAIKEALAYGKALGKSGHDKIFTDPIKGGVQKTRKSIGNWVTNNRHHFTDNSLRGRDPAFEAKLKEQGLKPRSTHITFHGLRHAYTQERYRELRAAGYDTATAKRITSANLGHHRGEVVNIYLA